MSQALYRKYRSRTLDEIVGQAHITDVLTSALAQDRIGHAFLFTGPRGTGKTSVARILAHAINKLPYAKDQTHLDIIEIDAASNRRIDDIRDLREKVHVAPTSARYKVYIIDEVHMLTGESFNALLKTLEEPPSHVIFILATTEVHKLPATIISRTQRFHFRLIPEQEVIDHLRHIAKEEAIKISDDALRIIAQHGEGSFRDSISLLDQLGSLAGKDEITAKMVEMTLGLAPGTQVQALIEAVSAHQATTALTILKELEQAGVSASVLVGQLLQFLRYQPTLSSETVALMESLLEVPRSHNPHIKLLAVIARCATVASAAPTKVAATLAAAPTTPTVSASVTELRKKKPEAAKPVPRSKKETEEAKPSVPMTTTVIDAFDWNAVMETLSKKHAPAHSVLRHAVAQYNEGILTLYFAYPLHRKKIEDAKYRTILANCIIEIYSSCPEITTLVGSAPPADETAASVAEIMGGGEAVNV